MSTEGLMFPSDPLAAMRQLQELDAPKPQQAQPTQQKPRTKPSGSASMEKAARPAKEAAGKSAVTRPAMSSTSSTSSDKADDSSYGHTVIQQTGNTVIRSQGHIHDNMTSHTGEQDRESAAGTGQYIKPSPQLKKQMRALKEGERKTKTFKITPALERWMKKHIADRWDNPPEHQEILERGLLLYMLEQETGQDLLELDKE